MCSSCFQCHKSVTKSHSTWKPDIPSRFVHVFQIFSVLNVKNIGSEFFSVNKNKFLTSSKTINNDTLTFCGNWNFVFSTFIIFEKI